MHDPSGARSSVALSGLSIAVTFRDAGASEGKATDILFFIDNIFRFTQAGSEVSALLGRMPSAVGYQPTLASEMGAMQERITSTIMVRLLQSRLYMCLPRLLDRPGTGYNVYPLGCNNRVEP